MPRPIHTILLLPCLLLAACGGSGYGGGGQNPPVPPPPPPPPPTTVQTQQVFAGVTLSLPTSLVQAPNDASRWFAIEKAGRIIVFDNDTVGATGKTFLDISPWVESIPSEAGLLGIAFHPEFANNGEVFVSYTAPGAPLTSVISRFRSSPDNQTLDPTSEEPILTVFQPRTNHNGGDIAFGPDGFLYAGFGDGGGGGDPDSNGQNKTTLLGSIIRIDVDVPMGYSIPTDNPFEIGAQCSPVLVGNDCPEIYAWGFRNPWRISFDSLTGELWVGDVGQGEWEEVDRVELGENFGWNTREGAHCYPPGSSCNSTGLTDPITEYANSGGSAITGGYVYRGSAIPTLQGQYVFADFASGQIWAVPADSPIGTTPTEIANTGHSISAFGEGVDGELYVFDYGNGTIHQIVP